MSSLMMPFDHRDTLDGRVHELLATFRQQWERHWGLRRRSPPKGMSQDDWDVIHRLFKTADRLVRAAENLSRAKLPDDPRSLPAFLAAEAESERRAFEEVIESFRSDLGVDPEMDLRAQRFLKFVRDELFLEAQQRDIFFRTAVELLVQERFGCLPGPMAERAIQLLPFLAASKSERVREYLRRVARCFILDLRPELAIMARAVMEAALDDHDLDSTVEFVRRTMGGSSRPTLSHKLEAASQRKLLDEGGRTAAAAVKDAGDDAVHNAPGLAPDPINVMFNLHLVLGQLERNRR